MDLKSWLLLGHCSIAASADMEGSSFRVLSLSVHHAVHINVAPDEISVIIWPKNGWIHASEKDTNQISPSDRRYGATHESALSDVGT